MADSPVRISVELEGIEPNERFRAACDELAAAAAELIEETADVTGFLLGDEVGADRAAWTDLRPGVEGFHIGVLGSHGQPTAGVWGGAISKNP